MSLTYGIRDIARDPSLLRIAPDESIIIEDKTAHKRLGGYLGTQLAEEFLAYQQKQKLLASANKINQHAQKEHESMASPKC